MALSQLEDALLNYYKTQQQLDSVVQRALDEPLGYIISPNNNLKTIVNELLRSLELDGRIRLFLRYISKTNISPELRNAIELYSGNLAPSPNPYTALIVSNQPFVDRTSFRGALARLFGENLRVLIMNGNRYSGRTYSRLLVQHVAENIGIIPLYIDLMNGLQSKEVQDIVLQCSNYMSLPPSNFRDPAAQQSTQTKGFIYFLIGWFRSLEGSQQRWCFIFDHYDRDEVLPACREFVDLLIEELINNSGIINVRTVLLGNKPVIPRTIASYILNDRLEPFLPSDVEQYLGDIAQRNGRSVSAQDLLAQREKVFEGLTQPLDLDGLYTVTDRLAKYIQ